MTFKLFLDVGGLESNGAPLGDYNNDKYSHFDFSEMYKSYLRGPHYFVARELNKAGSLSVESRLLHYLVAYILVQHNTNHVQPTINDLKLMFTIREGILVNCPTEILKVMYGIASSSSRLLSYGIFLSQIIDHLEIDTSDMHFIVINSREHFISDTLIHKMNIYKYGES
ncbi:hypothetical protein Lal_00018485 [Lupinus albus]|nr:hypothetical protein Lal_00018485 [Lupinus albus]